MFSAIGYTYGGSGGSFNIPDIRGRIPVCVGTGSGLTARTLAQTGGEESHTLTTNEMPSHSHTSNATGGQGNLGLAIADGSNTVTSADSSQGELNVWTTPRALTINNTGGGAAHNVMQPFIVLRYLIKY